MTLGVPNVQVSSTNCPLIQQVTEPGFGSLVTDDVSALSVCLLMIAQRLLEFSINQCGHSFLLGPTMPLHGIPPSY